MSRESNLNHVATGLLQPESLKLNGLLPAPTRELEGGDHAKTVSRIAEEVTHREAMSEIQPMYH